jgi:peptidylprolyl isomerase
MLHGHIPRFACLHLTPPITRVLPNQQRNLSIRPFYKNIDKGDLKWTLGTAAVVGSAATLVYYLNVLQDRRVNGTTKTFVEPQAEITSKAYFDVSIDNQPAGRIVFGLYGGVVPETVNNFQTICVGREQIGKVNLAYKNTPFHRIIPGFMIQGGDFTKHDGTGGRSIYGTPTNGRFRDENFKLKHEGPGVLAMANSGPNTNGSQFYIATAKTRHLDGRHVVFGTVVDGWDVVKAVEGCGSSSGKPSKTVKIEDCGLLEV